jgi:hypothetical protein
MIPAWVEPLIHDVEIAALVLLAVTFIGAATALSGMARKRCKEMEARRYIVRLSKGDQK